MVLVLRMILRRSTSVNAALSSPSVLDDSKETLEEDEGEEMRDEEKGERQREE